MKTGGSKTAGRIQSNDDPDEDPDELSKDTIFELLSVQRRREVLNYIREVGEKTTLSDLAEHVAAKEHEIEPYQLSHQQRKRVYIALYQSHLPQLDKANVIDYDEARGTVKLRPEAGQLIPYLGVESTEPNRFRARLRVGIRRWLEAIRDLLRR